VTNPAGRWPAPDWYRDPSDRHAMRYWDGEQWTAQVADGTRLGSDPVADSDELSRLFQVGGDLRSAWPPRVAVVSVGVFVVADLVTLMIRWLAAVTDLGPIATLSLVGVSLYGSLIVAGVAVYRRYASDVPFSEAFGLRWRWSDLPFGFVVSIVARITATLAVLPLLRLSRRLVGSNLPTKHQVGNHVPVLIAVTFLAVVAAPLVEEFFFRGLIQRSLETALPAPAAIADASVLFGLAHLNFHVGVGGVGLVLVTGTGGAVFGFTAHRRKRIGTSVLAHAFFNAVPIAILWAAT